MPDVGVVVIGRNEGARLRRCLTSLAGLPVPIVYVDSGSVDGSAELARLLGAAVVELDASTRFTAARARNAGLDALLHGNPALEFVQFVDGDCEMTDGWIQRGLAELRVRHDAAAACGRIRERSPEASIYNRLCELEWDLPVGEIAACGGIALMRVEALRRVGGFNANVIAAEDTELCLRLRCDGWKILHIAADMARHDAAILCPSQWWKRCVRAGYGFAQFSRADQEPTGRFFFRHARRTWFWACLLPALVLVLALPSRGISLALLAGYPMLTYRVYRRVRGRCRSTSDAVAFAVACTVAKYPQMIGMLRYWSDRFRKRQTTIIEHKSPDIPPHGRDTELLTPPV